MKVDLTTAEYFAILVALRNMVTELEQNRPGELNAYKVLLHKLEDKSGIVEE